MEVTTGTVTRAEMGAQAKRMMMCNFIVAIIAVIIAIAALVMAGGDDDKDSVDLSGYATKDDVAAATANASTQDVDLTDYATKNDVATAIANQQAPAVDLSNYATKNDVTAATANQPTQADLDAVAAQVDDKVTQADLASATRSAAAQRNIKLAMAIHGSPGDQFWDDNVLPGFQQAVADMHVVGQWIPVERGDWDNAQKFAENIESAAYSMVDGLATTISDFDALKGALNTALSEPVPMVSLNSGIDTWKQAGSPSARISTHVGQDEKNAGKQAGALMASYEGVTKAACIMHEQSNTALTDRCREFCTEFVRLRSGLDCLQRSELWATQDDATVKANMSEQMEGEWADVNAFLVTGPKYGEIMHDLINDSPHHDFTGAKKTYYGTFDTSSTIYQHIANGQMSFAISQNPHAQGYLPIVFLALNAEIGVMPGAGNVIQSGPTFIADADTAAGMMSVNYKDPVGGALKPRSEIKIAVIVHGTGLKSPFWKPVFKGVQQAAGDLGVKVEYHHSARVIEYAAEYDETENKRLIDTYGPQVDGIAFSIFHNDLLPNLQAVCANKPCVSLNSGMNAVDANGKDSGKFTHVGMDEYQAGSVGGAAFRDKYGVEKLTCVLYDKTNSALGKRCQGAKTFNCKANSELDQSEPAVLDGGVNCDQNAPNNTRDYTIVEILMADASCNGKGDTWTCSSGRNDCPIPGTDACCDCLDANSRTQTVYRSGAEYQAALTAYFTNGGAGEGTEGILAVGALFEKELSEALGRKATTTNVLKDNSIKVGLFDCGSNTLNGIIAGDFTFCLDQQPFLQGYLPVVLLTNAIQWGEKVGGGLPIYSGPQVVDKDNADSVLFYAEQGYR